jgi:uroporphyrinogen decarboxylase
MNSYERVAAAFAGDWPDTTPVMLHNFMMAAREAGVSMRQFRSDPEALARSFIEAVGRYGYDGVMVDVDTVTLAGAAGVPVDAPEDEPARIMGPRLQSLDEIADLPPVDILRSPGVQVWLEGVRLLHRQFGREIYLRGNCDQCPFTLASMVRGMDALLIEILDPEREEQIHRLLAYCTDITLQFIRAMAETGAHMTSNGDSMAGPAVVSPSIFRRFALPYDKRVADASHALGLPHVLHICGNTDAILADMVRTGSDGLEIDYKTDIRRARRVVADTTVVIGNIDPSGVLALGTPDLVREKTRELLTVFSDTPRFVLNAGCAIPAGTPPENLHAMISTARELRR